VLGAKRHRRAHVIVALRHQHGERLDLVDRCIGRVAAARGEIGQQLAGYAAAKALPRGILATRVERERSCNARRHVGFVKKRIAAVREALPGATPAIIEARLWRRADIV
jgi:hypothetical protein